MKFTIVTVCRNAESLIGDTAQSVLNQTAVRAGRAELQYVICDGASSDRTLDVLREFKSPQMTIHSAPDKGMYDALANGLRLAEGEWVGYLNAGDILADRAFDTILDAAANPNVRWLTGIASRYNVRGSLTWFSLPYRYRRSLIQSGQYSHRMPYFLPWIQQESTFWRASLLDNVDFDRLRSFSLAGDAYLWSCFARTEELYIVAAHLGGFREHPNQLSDRKRAYKEEVREFARPPRLRDAAFAVADHVLWHMPARFKKLFNPKLMIQYDFRSGQWT